MNEKTSHVENPMQSRVYNMIEFAKHANDEVSTRSSDQFDLEELEFLVEGSINYLHAKAYIQDENSEIYRDSAVVDFIEAISSEADAKFVYREIRKMLRLTFDQSTLPNKWVVWADIELVPQSDHLNKVYWAIKIGENTSQNVNERTGYPTCDFYGNSDIDGYYAAPYIATCALTNVGYGPISSNEILFDIRTKWNINSASDFDGWSFYCSYVGQSSTLCSQYYNGNGSLNSAGIAAVYLDDAELQYNKDQIEDEALYYRDEDGPGYIIIDIDGNFEPYLGLDDVGGRHFYEVTKAQITLGEGGQSQI